MDVLNREKLYLFRLSFFPNNLFFDVSYQRQLLLIDQFNLRLLFRVSLGHVVVPLIKRLCHTWM